MTPPPNPGEETPKPDDDPLGGMDPMAWLESLARRQGANPDELVTGGNLELPPAPESAPESATEAETEPVVRAEPPAHEMQPLQPAHAVPEPAGDLSDFTGGMDPMAWLEALARRQGAPTDELVTGGTAEIPAIPVTPPVSDEVEPLDLGEEFDLEPLPDEILDGTSPLAWLSGLAATEAGGAPQPVGAESGAKEDPLDGMDPMAWLEALARGEGVSGDEALPESMLDMVQDGEEESQDFEAVGAAMEAESAVEIIDGSDPMAWLAGADLGEAESAEMPAAEPPQAVPEPASDLSDFTGGMDPMAWLEALARRQGAPTDELVTGGTAEIPPEPVEAEAAVPEPVAELPETTPEPEAEPEFTWEPLAEVEAAEPPHAVPEPASDLSDFTGGMDPMAWLEALARRQGAPTDELVTGGTAEIPPEPVEAEAAVPEPVAELPETTPEPVEILDAADPLAWLSEVTGEASISLDSLGLPGEMGETLEPEAATPQPEPAADLSEFTGGEDPLRWLESLAARQGVNRDELVTPADLEIPVPAADAPVDGPGYSELDVFSVTAPGRAPGEAPEGVTLPEAMSDADALAWLESLTGASQIDLSMLDVPPAGAASDVTDQTMTAESALSWLESLAHETPISMASSEPAAPEAATAAEAGDRMAGGMSDDVDEVRAWLEAQARELEQTREQLEAEEPYVAAEMPSLSDEPAVPGEVPDWLTSLHEASLDVAQAESPLIEDVALPDVPSDLPTWLTEAQPGVDLEALELDEALPQAEVSPEPEAISLPTFSPDELEALTRPASPDDVDSWAEALDEEYNRRLAGDETIPDWYLDAIRRAEGEWTGDAAPVSAESEATLLEGEPEPLIARDEIPDWLRASVPEPPVAVQGEDLSDVPPWLVEMSAGIDLPSPQPSLAAPAPEEVRPPWLPPPNEAPAHAEPAAVEPARPAMAAPPTPPPAPTPVAPPRSAPRTLPPSRYHEVLRDARQFASAPEQVNTALELYQALVDDSQLLEEAREDLKLLAQQNPGQPKVHRLLGDTYMRMGDLQSALDTYLSALDQL